MASVTRARLIAAASRPAPRVAGRGGTTAIGVVGLALAAATATGVALPRATYTAAAVVGVDGGPAGLRPALIQAAADAARSRQVAGRAAADLTGKAATRPEALAAAIRVDAGRVPGTLILRADDADAERAASLASALARALVAELEDRTQATRRDGDAAEALRVSRLQAASMEAHRKLTALGGDAADPAAGRTTAATRAEALRVRLDAIKSILAAGEPPLGAGRDVPPNIEALQTSYLDLTRQLAKARETLGERHTTVIGLNDAVRRSASELSAAWHRLAKLTEQDLGEAKARAAAPSKGGLDASRIAALDAARVAVRVADDAVARASAPGDGDEQPRWHLVARASAPALAEGLGLTIRLAIAAAVGLLALGLGLHWRRRTRPSEAEAADAAESEASPTTMVEPSFFDDEPASHEAVEPAPLPARIEPELAAPRHLDVPPSPAPRDETALDEMDELLEETSEMDPTHADADLIAAAAQVLPSIDAVTPRDGVPVVLVATNEAGVGTIETVLALGVAAAAEGRRVLIVEGPRARPALASAVDPDAVPALVDVLGETRIALRAEAGSGQLYLAPSFRDGARLAADLERAGTALVADALADEFDLVILDGDRALDAAALADEADAFLRVGRFASPRDAAHFLAALGAPRGTFLGTVAAAVSVFVPQAVPARAATPTRPVPVAARAPRSTVVPHPLRRPAPADARRRVGAR